MLSQKTREDLVLILMLVVISFLVYPNAYINRTWCVVMWGYTGQIYLWRSRYWGAVRSP